MRSAAAETSSSDAENVVKPAVEGEAIVHLAALLRVMLFLGIGLALLGAVVGLVRDGVLPTDVTAVRSLASGIVDLDPAAILTLGIFAILFTPMLSMAYLSISYLRARDWMYAAVAAIVLAILIGSIVVAAISGGSEPSGKPALRFPTEAGVFAISIVGGILGSMLGLGGGVFIVPVLSAFFGIPLKTAIAASAVSVVVNSIGGTSVYLRHQMTNVRLALFMELTTTIGAILGGFIVVYLAPNPLRVVFGVALMAMAIALFLRQKQAAPVATGPDRLRLRQIFHDPAAGTDVDYIPQKLGIGVSASSAAGVISGMLGIGGGAVKVPIMNAVMRVPVKAAAATSVFMVGITISASAFIYYVHSIIDLSVTIPAMLGVLIGSQAGARISRRLRNVVLVRSLVLILIYLAINLLLQAAGVHIPGTK
jgi:uncharacterized membrane protein YfcA